jgi:hypothetical protein
MAGRLTDKCGAKKAVIDAPANSGRWPATVAKDKIVRWRAPQVIMSGFDFSGAQALSP